MTTRMSSKRQADSKYPEFVGFILSFLCTSHLTFQIQFLTIRPEPHPSPPTKDEETLWIVMRGRWRLLLRCVWQLIAQSHRLPPVSAVAQLRPTLLPDLQRCLKPLPVSLIQSQLRRRLNSSQGLQTAMVFRLTTLQVSLRDVIPVAILFLVVFFVVILY